MSDFKFIFAPKNNAINEKAKSIKMSQFKKCLYIIDLLKHRGPMTLDEINKSFRNSYLYDKNIEPRTFARYKDYIAMNFPYYIEYNAKIRKYELFCHKPLYGEDNSLYDYLLSAYHVEGLSELAIKHQDKILMSEVPTGVENVHIILEAIDKQRGLECDYYSFSKKAVKHQTVIPAFLKTWEQRWYLVAQPANQEHGLSVYALERMDNVRLTDERMVRSVKTTPEDYFDGSFGVNHSDNQKPETLRVKVYGAQVDYVRALPIHESQEEVETTGDWSIFEYRVVPCFNLYQQLLWHREKLEVLEPIFIRHKVKSLLNEMLELYKE